jgi:Hypothetical glycosyl hydrolase family 15
MRRDARRLRRVPADVLILALLAALALPASALARRPIPNTNGAVHVWNDQLPDSMTPAQIRFVARHVDGTQKVSLATARRLRAFNRGFLVLYYRLGIGDGPVPFRLNGGWSSDYGFVTRHESWFWHISGRRVYQSQWGWYLMNPDTAWRTYWATSVLHQAGLLGDDGVFADSLSVPQYLGAESFTPPLRYFVGEAAWTARIDRFMRYEKRRLRGRLWFIPNAGSWITTRDRTDYAIADGVMIEGFAESAPTSPYALGDWRLEMNRTLSLVRRGRVLIAQSYLSPGDLPARTFVLGSYLLIKGSRTFLNMDIGQMPQWFPEYGVPLGPALTPPPASIDALRVRGGLFVRRYAHGLVAVNPDDRAHALAVPAGARLVVPVGGGALNDAADTRGWGLGQRPVHGSFTLPAHGGAVFLT